MPLYQITNKDDGITRLVSAKSQAEALRHIASTTFEVTLPTPVEAARLGLEGVTIAEAGVATGTAVDPNQQHLPIPDPQ